MINQLYKLTFLGQRQIYIVLVSALLLVSVNPSSAESTTIRCQSTTNDEITVTLSEKKQFGKLLNCISANFIADMTPCAPTGGFGLSYPTGGVGLSRIVMRWQDYGDHFGGVTGSFLSPSEITFTIGWMGDGGYTQEAGFSIDRISGAATLQTFENSLFETHNGTFKYTCNVVKPKF